jgi:hypothetical protein
MMNTHITLFPGLPNINLPLPPATTLSDLLSTIYARLSLPPTNHLLLSTTSGQLLTSHNHDLTLNDLTSNDFLTLRLTPPLCGGKGGFGSQLRAAGGRMSSRKKGQENSDSCRNLDGRRMRTVKEAKALAAWLEVKPEMEKQEREKRMKRWRDIVEAAEKKEEGKGQRFDDVEWLEGLEEGRERTRDAVLAAFGDRGVEGLVKRWGAEDGGSSSGESSGGASEEETEDGGAGDVVKLGKAVVEKRFAGWDDEDEEFMSSDEDMEDVEEEEEVVGKGKGKAKVQ